VEVYRLPVRIDKMSLARQFLAYLRFFTLATAQLTKLHLRRRYRTVHVHNLPDFLVFCALVPKLQRVPVILDLHDLMPEFFEGRFGDRRPTLARLVRIQERLSCAFADHVITVSEQWRQALIRRGVPPSRCSVTMNVPDETVFVPLPQRAATGSEFRLFFHGTVAYRYGLDLAIRAVAMLRADIPEIRLTILGIGDHRPALVELTRELGVEDIVLLREEAVLREELPGIIAGAQAGIVPYRNDVFTDGIVPTKLMEYIAMRIPCIAARTTANVEYFGDSMVEFFDPDDVEDLARAIRTLHASPERRAELVERAARFTERYNWTTVGTAFVRLIDDLSGRGRAGVARR
jgi:glycosyltransferase involved in cell wall biosynthesis